MKIAIYDPDPACGGLMSWGRQMQAGLRAAGAECDIVSFTKSGRPRKCWGRPDNSTEWYDRPLDAVGAYKSCKDLLSQYDRVVLAEPLSGQMDRQAAKEGWAMPYYARVLEVAGVPFTTVLQSFSYAVKDAPYAAYVLGLPSFIGTGFAHASPTRVTKDNTAMHRVEWVQAPHPYTPARAVEDPVPPRGVAGCTGRFAHLNAFQIPAVAVAMGYARIPDAAITLQLRGACAVSARPSYSLEIYETIRDSYGYNAKREGEGAIRPWNWVLWDYVDSDDPADAIVHSIIRYDGAYSGGTEGAVQACSTMQAHISLMAQDKSTWVTNYAQLEAMDAGCTPVATSTHWSSWFRGHVLPPLPSTPATPTLLKDATLHPWLKEAGAKITEAMELSDEARTGVARHNREMLRLKHDPEASAKVLLEVLGG